jgi:hypothetical protein
MLAYKFGCGCSQTHKNKVRTRSRFLFCASLLTFLFTYIIFVGNDEPRHLKMLNSSFLVLNSRLASLSPEGVNKWTTLWFKFCKGAELDNWSLGSNDLILLSCLSASTPRRGLIGFASLQTPAL